MWPIAMRPALAWQSYERSPSNRILGARGIQPQMIHRRANEFGVAFAFLELGLQESGPLGKVRMQSCFIDMGESGRVRPGNVK
jgi:hypothetical protein